MVQQAQFVASYFKDQDISGLDFAQPGSKMPGFEYEDETKEALKNPKAVERFMEISKKIYGGHKMGKVFLHLQSTNYRSRNSKQMQIRSTLANDALPRIVLSEYQNKFYLLILSFRYGMIRNIEIPPK